MTEILFEKLETLLNRHLAYFQTIETKAIQSLINGNPYYALSVMFNEAKLSRTALKQAGDILGQLPTIVTPPAHYPIIQHHVAMYGTIPDKLFNAYNSAVIQSMVARKILMALPPSFQPYWAPIFNKAQAHTFTVQQEIAHKRNFEDPYQGLVSEFNPDYTTKSLLADIGQINAHFLPIQQLRLNNPEVVPNMQLGVSKKNKANIMKWLVAKFSIPSAKVQHYNGPPASLGNPKGAVIINDLNVTNFEQFFGDGTHEVGHAFYKTNLPSNKNIPLYHRTPLSTGFDEGQAYLSENYLHQDPSYITYFCKVLHKDFGLYSDQFNSVQLANYHYKLRTSANRLECDDLTNLLYINALIAIEKSVIEGNQSPTDIPKLWAEKLTPIIGAKAVREDPYGYARTMQWSAGLIGNFPGYLQGHKAAPQIWKAIQQQSPNLNEELVRGDLSTYRTFLVNNFYQYGSQIPEQVLFQQATGAALNCDALMADWGKKYNHQVTNPL